MSRVQQTVNMASDAALAIDAGGRILAWNEKAQELLGYCREEVLGRRCSFVLQAILPGGEPLCGPNCEIFHCFNNRVPRGVEDCRVQRKSGEWVTVRYSSLISTKQDGQSGDQAALAVIFLGDCSATPAAEQQERMLQVFTLGKFGLSVGGGSVALEKWVRKQAVTLLKYLVTQIGRPVHRERILCCLWPETDTGRAWDRLKVTISYLRGQLRDLGLRDDVLTTIGKAYLLRRDAIQVDAELFERLIAEGRVLQAQQDIERALRRYEEAEDLYRGDYLEQEIFTDWCAEERERLRELYLEMMADMVLCHERRNEHADAARLCRKALVHEPCREGFHRKLVECLFHLGHPDQALSQYHACRQLLKQELGVEPMPETQRIYRAILKNTDTIRAYPGEFHRLDWSGSGSS